MTVSADQRHVADPVCQRDEIDYLRSREAEERALAASATIPSVRDTHFQVREAAALFDGEQVPKFENRYRTTTGDFREIDWTAVSDGNFIHALGRDQTEQ